MEPLPQARGFSSTMAAQDAASALPSHHLPDPGAFGKRFCNPWDTYEERGFKHVSRVPCHMLRGRGVLSGKLMCLMMF